MYPPKWKFKDIDLGDQDGHAVESLHWTVKKKKKKKKSPHFSVIMRWCSVFFRK
jgi:hypothetical protein